MKKTSLLLATLLIAGAVTVSAQPSRTNSPNRIYRDQVDPHWFAGESGETNQFWYRVNLPGEQREFVLVDAAKGTRLPAFDHERLAKALAQATSKNVDAKRLPVDSIAFARDGKAVTIQTKDGEWKLDLESYSLSKSNQDGGEEKRLPVGRTPHPSRDGEPSEIRFSNRLKQAVNLFWIAGDGNRQAYGTLQPNETRDQNTYAGHVWLVTSVGGDILAVFEAEAKPGLAVIDDKTNNVVERPRRRNREPGQRSEPVGIKSPDQKLEVLVHGHNLFLRDVASGKESQLSYDANPDSSYSRSAEYDRAVDMEYDRTDPEVPTPDVYWSPDSKHFVAMRRKPGTQRKVYLVESSPEDQLQPKLVSLPYLKPGDEVPYSKPHLFDVAEKKEIPVSDALFPNPWSVGEVRWNTNSSEFTFVYNQRGHQVLRVIAVDAASGAAKPVVDEQSKTFICYSGKYFCEYLDDTGELIWMSERDGWNHLYLYDAKTGQVKNQITKGEWVVRGVDRVDKEKRQVWLHVSGVHPAEDPYYIHYCRVNFDGSGLTFLTDGDGTHSVQFSPDNRYVIDSWSRVDMPPITELRRTADGKLACRLEEADAKELFASGWRTPERFNAKGRDGATDIYGVIFRPKNFDPAKKYPILEDIYAGPQDSFTPKSFRTSYRDQKLADRGFIVVQMDGMGTANRSKKFHDVCFKNLQDAGFPDRVLWIKAAAAKYSFMDLTRVGLFGTSAGAQDSLRGLLDHGDFYKAGVSDCGCHDNRMDKVWWNEQWLGWPVDESYVRASNVADAHKLTGKLLLMVGEMDRNVDPSSTMQVVNALIKADKDFEMYVLPGVGHGVVRTPWGARQLEDFFVRTFLKTN